MRKLILSFSLCLFTLFAFTQASGNIDLGSEITSGITTGGCTSGCIPAYCSTAAGGNHSPDTKTILITGIPAANSVEITFTSVNCNPGTSGLDGGDDIFIDGTKVFDGSGNALAGFSVCVAGGSTITVDVITNRRDEIVNVSWASGPTDGVMGCFLVPVVLTSFSAENRNEQIHLDWTTSSEVNNDYFEIQHSLDGSSFETIGMQEGNGNSSITNNYSFLHETPKSGINFYRLKQNDFDGAFEFSDVTSVRTKEVKEISLFPNPVQNELTISLQDESSENLVVEIIDASGRVALKQSLKSGNAIYSLDTSRLQNGNYLIRIQGNNIQHSKSFVKI